LGFRDNNELDSEAESREWATKQLRNTRIFGEAEGILKKREIVVRLLSLQ
jgi:hypothetical protein